MSQIAPDSYAASEATKNRQLSLVSAITFGTLLLLLAALLAWAGHTPTAAFDPATRREADLDRLADAVEEHMDLAKLERWLPGISG